MRPCMGVEQDARVTLADQDGLAEAYRAHGAKLWRALIAYAGDREVADDAL